jgi:DNA-binding CsgD family transcriptional regulator
MEISMVQPTALSKREQDVVNLLLEGKSNKLIASALHISNNTVEFHLKRIYAKFQVNSRMELVLKLGSPIDGKLRDSIVVQDGDVAENRDRLKFLWSNWVTSFREAISIIAKELKMEKTLHSNVGDSANMTFYESIRVCLTKYAEFNGRASRPEFWWFTLFVGLAAAALTYLDENVARIFLIAMLLPQLAVGTRRLRDTGKSGWWQLFLLVPIAGLVLVGILWALPTSSLADEAAG